MRTLVLCLLLVLGAAPAWAQSAYQKLAGSSFEQVRQGIEELAASLGHEL